MIDRVRGFDDGERESRCLRCTHNLKSWHKNTRTPLGYGQGLKIMLLAQNF